jgi:hypothetical protein
MRLPKYHLMRTGIQGNASPGSERDVSEVAVALRDQLRASGLFETVEVEPTHDVDRLVIALCHFRPDVSEWDVAAHLEEVWNDRIRYGFWEAHAFLTAEDHVELEGATRVRPDGHYVTVHLVAEKARIPLQREPDA